MSELILKKEKHKTTVKDKNSFFMARKITSWNLTFQQFKVKYNDLIQFQWLQVEI